MLLILINFLSVASIANAKGTTSHNHRSVPRKHRSSLRKTPLWRDLALSSSKDKDARFHDYSCRAPDGFDMDPMWWLNDARFDDLYSCEVDGYDQSCDYTDAIRALKRTM